MRVARSKFLIGDHELVVPELPVTVPHAIREASRNLDFTNPLVERAVALFDITIMLRFAYPWITAQWLEANLTTEVVVGLIENLATQMDMAVATRKSPAPPPSAGARRLN